MEKNGSRVYDLYEDMSSLKQCD